MTYRLRIFLAVAVIIGFLCGPVLAATRVLVDQTGRSVRVPVNPQRVVSLAPSITEIVYDLHRENRLAGVTRFSDYPKAAESLPKVGTYVYLDLEKIVSLKPDLCIAIKDGNPKDIIDRLVHLGIPVYAVNPKDLKTVMDTVTRIGELLSAKEPARKLVAAMHRRIDDVEGRVARAKYHPRVFFQVGVSPIVSAGSGTFINELIQRAGGINIAGKYSGYPRFSMEKVLADSPDIIIVSSMARHKSYQKVINGWRKWTGLPAVRHNRIYLVNADILDRPTPRMVDGLEKLARMIHPELFNGSTDK